MPPESLGPYRIGKRLGRGGMGTVYEAVNRDTGEEAAIKVLNPAFVDEEGFRERFEIEIETLKKLKHPQIARLYGYGSENDDIYYVMELVHGSNLEDELQRGRRFDWRETIRAGVKLCRALKLAHDHGIVHRDIKPANILVTPDDDFKLTDFGIAKLFGSAQLTSAGGLIGTVEYMSPEQADGKPVDARSDLYSLGGVLFAMLTGRPPFKGKSLPEVLQMQRFAEPPRANQFAPETPAALADMIGRLLSKAPADRAANAGILARELSAMEHGLTAKSTKLRGGDGPTAGDFSLSQSETLAGESQSSYQAESLDPDSPTRIAGEPTTQAAPGVPAARVAKSAGFDDPVRSQRLPRTNRFLTIEEENAEAELRERNVSRRNTILQSSLLVAVLSLIGVAGWLATRPPSLDALYRKVQTSVEQGERSGEITTAMESFLERAPGDPRRPEVEKWLADARLERLERTLRLRASLGGEEAENSISREYLAAVDLANVDPQTALARLRALKTIYSGDRDSSEHDRLCLELVKRQIDKIETEIARRSAFDVATIRQRMAIADKLKSLEERRAHYAAILELYGDRAWVADDLTEIRRRLAAQPDQN